MAGRLPLNSTPAEGVYATSPAIAADGTIYVGDENGGLQAFNPNGTPKWSVPNRTMISSPAVGADGTVYACFVAQGLQAINPNGTEKWTFHVSSTGSIFYCDYSSPAIGADGTVFIGGDGLYAINSDGTEKWRMAEVADFMGSSPAIGSDGTVYIGGRDHGRLYAAGVCDGGEAVDGVCPVPPDPAHIPTARFTTSDVVGFVGIPLGFDAFYSTDPQNDIVGYSWDFGDASPLGHSQAISKVYSAEGSYLVTLTVTDGEGLQASTERQVQILPADQIGLFNAYVSFTTSFNRLVDSGDRIKLKARVNVGDTVVAAGDAVALEIAGKRFEAVLDETLRAKLAGPPNQKWKLLAGTRVQAFGEVDIWLTINKADLGLGFNLLGALPDGDGMVTIDVPVHIEVGTQSFELPISTDFQFNSAGTKARGSGASD